jgi:sporulation protein YtfJ
MIMEKRPVSDFISTTMEKVREMIDTNTVIGQPIKTDDGITLIPVSNVSFGFAGGGSDFQTKHSAAGKQDPFGGGTGAGVKVTPVAFVVIKDGSVRVINIMPPASSALDRLIEMLPDAFDKIEGMVKSKNAGAVHQSESCGTDIETE